MTRLPPLYTLIFFNAVARHLSFTKASEELCVTQSAVSKQVKFLEERLGYPLFFRTGRGVVLTQAGQEIFNSVSPLFNELGATIARIDEWSNSSRFTIACTQAVAHFWLFPLVVQFNSVYPNVSVNILATNDIDVRSCESADLCILYGNGSWSDIQADLLFKERIFPVCAYDYPSTILSAPADLLEHRLIQLDPHAWRWINWNDWFAHFDLPYKQSSNTLVFNQATLAMDASVRGLGVSLAWEFMVGDVINKNLIRRFGNFVFETGSADYLAYSSVKPLRKTAQLFREWLLMALDSEQVY